MKWMNGLLVVAVAALAFGCGEATEPTDTSEGELANETWTMEEESCAPHTTTIYAGQTIDAGSVTVSNDATNLYVDVTATGGWAFNTLHLYAGFGPIPVNPAGTPVPGQFPYKADFVAPYPTSHTFTVALDDLGAVCGETLKVALHAAMLKFNESGEIVQTETGWGFGDGTYNSNRWGWWFNYEICCDEEDPEYGCTLTQGYWKNHNSESPRSNQAIDWPAPYDEADLLCGQTWLDILNTQPAGDAWYIVAHQYIAARLNTASASAPADVSDALEDSGEWLEDNCGGATSSDSADALDDAALLDDYNNGVVGPGHCG